MQRGKGRQSGTAPSEAARDGVSGDRWDVAAGQAAEDVAAGQAAEDVAAGQAAEDIAAGQAAEEIAAGQAAQSTGSPQSPSFEEGLSQLADLVGRLEGGQLGLADSISAYERGVSLLRRLHEELSTVEQRVHMLTRGSSESPATAEQGPEDHGTESPGQFPSVKPGKRSPPRTADGQTSSSRATRPRRLPGMDDSSAEA